MSVGVCVCVCRIGTHLSVYLLPWLHAVDMSHDLYGFVNVYEEEVLTFASLRTLTLL